MQSWIVNADQWTDIIRGGGIESRRLVTVQAIVDAVLAQQPKRVLDLGCGEGWLVRRLCQQGVDAVGLDGSPTLIAAAQSAGGGKFQVCTYFELANNPSHAGNGFDVISANFSILYQEAAALLKTLRRLLVPRGRIVLQSLHPWSVADASCDGWREESFHDFEGSWLPMP
ncbi:bifunctional 2-polyprenyl-6-hydroxyphenol methylase/3-demethylubiquinol 3-O-methyltransferase UbiG [Cyanobium sp. LEGE 06113]|uniref:class I SAM-dependent methyltransferase n=1 Tax=Cyanobium sp. LEGE 06113 TaxID=1297573 RepID=UPI00187FE36B|nr:class I SAM-dependent methyltransferase [Cyanobium sp. LEGE 06113]MBE9153628.1 class I SAM-dependent methyltransferase [Cyanobium sp. LEGE 06113]